MNILLLWFYARTSEGHTSRREKRGGEGESHKNSTSLDSTMQLQREKMLPKMRAPQLFGVNNGHPESRIILR